MPVKGIIPTMAAILIAAWAVIQIVMPAATKRANSSLVANAIRKPRQANNPNSAITMPQPIKPNSSPMIANTESLVASGK